MSYLDKLLEGVGVEWKALGDVADIATGSSNREDKGENGSYPFYVRSKHILKADSFEFDDVAIVIPGEGGIGDIFHYVEGKYALHQRAYRIHIVSDVVSTKFLFHFMSSSFKKYILMKSVGATAISIRKPMIQDFKIPIPCPENAKKSLEIQAEIVRILDNFTELTAELTTELTAELTARKKQYNYYRDQLLSFEDGELGWRALGEVANLRRGRVMSKEYLAENAGDHPVYSSQTANNGEIGKIKTFDFNGEFISWTTDGANAGTVFYRTGKFSTTNVCGLMKINNENKLNYKFLFYWLTTEAQKHVYSGMGNPKLMSHQVEKIPIPIPYTENPEKSLKIQAEIVRILDNFTELTAELTTELTAELTARKKQYEHYRDLLLRFPKLKEVAA